MSEDMRIMRMQALELAMKSECHPGKLLEMAEGIYSFLTKEDAAETGPMLADVLAAADTDGDGETTVKETLDAVKELVEEAGGVAVPATFPGNTMGGETDPVFEHQPEPVEVTPEPATFPDPPTDFSDGFRGTDPAMAETAETKA